MSNHYNSEEQEPNPVVEKITNTLNNLWRAFYISTFLFFKNFPSKIKNRFDGYLNERRRMPKRKSKHRVYVLIGYTSKEKVDKRYRSVKIQRLISTLLILGIVLIFLVLVYRTLNPKLDYDAYRQMIGVNDFDDLIKKDPFVSAENAAQGSDALTDMSNFDEILSTYQLNDLE